MPRIPQYQQDKLASSLVGTPGVDKSASILAQGLQQIMGETATDELAISNKQREVFDQNIAIQRSQQLHSFDVIGNELTRVQASKQAAIAQQVAQQNAATKQQEAWTNKTKLATNQVDLSGQLDGAVGQAWQLNKSDPLEASKTHLEQSQTILKNFLAQDEIKNNPQLLAELTGFGNDRIRQDQHALSKAATSEGMTTAVQNANEYVGKIVNDVVIPKEAGTDAETFARVGAATIGKAFRDLNTMEPGMVGPMGPDGARRFIDAAKGKAVYNYLKSAIEVRPDSARALLHGNAQDGLLGYLTAKQRDSLGTDLRETDARNAHIADHEETVTLLKNEQQLSVIENNVTSLDRTDPYRMDAAMKARDQFLAIKAPLLQVANPDAKTLKQIKAVDTSLGRMNTIISQEQGDAQHLSIENRRLALDEKRAANETRQADLQTKRDNYDALTDDRIAVREAVKAVKDSGNLQIPEILGRVQKATKLLNDLNNRGGAQRPGTKDTFFESNMAYLNGAITNLVDKVKPEDDGEWKFNHQITEGPPKTVMGILNPTGEKKQQDKLHTRWDKELGAGIKAFQAANHGRRPTDVEIVRILKPPVIRLMLGLPEGH